MSQTRSSPLILGWTYLLLSLPTAEAVLLVHVLDAKSSVRYFEGAWQSSSVFVPSLFEAFVPHVEFEPGFFKPESEASEVVGHDCLVEE